MTAERRIAVNQLPNTLADAPVMDDAEFTRRARDAETPLRFSTSRSGVSVPIERPDHVGRICADALRVAGLAPTDVHLNLSAPVPHSSGWSANRGFYTLGATSLNRDFTDWERPVEDGSARTATVVSSIPGKMADLAEEIEAAYGPPEEVFPALEIGAFAGQLLRPNVRETIESRWGLSETREFYGSSEASMIAAATDGSRRMVPLLNHHVIEIEVDGEIVDIRDVSEPTEGEILITDPARSAVTLRRYRQGDRVRVYPSDPIPRITPLGRADDAIAVEGALLHPGDLYDAIHETFPEATTAVTYVRDAREPVTLEVFLEGTSEQRTDELYEALVSRQPALGHAVGERPDERLEITGVNDVRELPMVPETELKSQLVVFESDREEQ